MVTNKDQLKRHGARWPVGDSRGHMKAAVDKLKRAEHYKEDYLEFLKNFQLELGEENLLPLGIKQCDRCTISVFRNGPDVVLLSGRSRPVPLPMRDMRLL